MTPIQKQNVESLTSEGFQIVEVNRDIVRLTRGPDARLVRQDGVVMRAQHEVRKVRILRGEI